jgi:hypothetical protein
MVSSAFQDETLLRMIGIATVVLSGACGIFVLKKLGDKEPGLIISEEGIMDRSNAGSIGFVPWADVLAIHETTVMNQKFVSVALKNPEHYIKLQPNKFKRKLINTNFKRFGYVVNITANSLQCHHHQLKALLNDALKSYLARNN